MIYYQQGNATIHNGDCLDVLRTLPDESVHCCVTSPPYWGLRDYGHDGQIGLEETPEAYVSRLVEVFREVRRVLRSDGTLWLNLGDSYNNTDKWGGGGGNTGKQTIAWTHADSNCVHEPIDDEDSGFSAQCVRCRKCGGSGIVESWAVRRKRDAVGGLKPKDLVGIPWRVAFALQADGWWLRQDIIWHKPNPMPESVRDRCTKAHEYVFLLAKSERYYYDAEAVAESVAQAGRIQTGYKRPNKEAMSAGPMSRGQEGFNHQFEDPERVWCDGTTRNRRSVWTVSTKPYAGAHFATMPPDLVEPCILAGTSAEGCCAACGAPWQRVVERETIRRNRPNAFCSYRDVNGQPDQTKAGISTTTLGWERTCECDEARVSPCTVLDPFNGAATVGLVSLQLQRRYVGIELNPEYCKISVDRINMEARQKRLFAASCDS